MVLLHRDTVNCGNTPVVAESTKHIVPKMPHVLSVSGSGFLVAARSILVGMQKNSPRESRRHSSLTLDQMASSSDLRFDETRMTVR